MNILFLSILLLIISASFSGCKVEDLALNLQQSSPKEFRLYAHPCGNGDPISRTCLDPADSIEVFPENEVSCEKMQLAEGDPCSVIERCVEKSAIACKDNPEQIVASATFLYCRNELDWMEGDAGCPVSTRTAKRNIHYLSADAKAGLAKEILGLQLAKYEYKPSVSKDQEQKIGFIIEDIPHSSFVKKKESRLDLYSYVSALVATVQKQQKEIEELRKEIHGKK